MPKPKPVTNITREGTVNFEIFKISPVIAPEERREFRVDKAKFFQQLFEDASYKVNSMTVSNEADRELNALLRSTPKNEPVPVSLYVYHCIQSSGLIFRVSDYIVSKTRLLL